MPIRGQDQGRHSAERPLQDDRPRHRPAFARVPFRRLVYPDGVAADRGGKHLAGGVGDEVRAGQPGDAVLDALRLQQQLPAPGHWRDGEERDPDRQREVPGIGVGKDVQRLADVDLPEDVGERQAGDRERQDEPDHGPPLHERAGSSSRLLRHRPCRSVCIRLPGRPARGPPLGCRRRRSPHRRGRRRA